MEIPVEDFARLFHPDLVVAYLHGRRSLLCDKVDFVRLVTDCISCVQRTVISRCGLAVTLCRHLGCKLLVFTRSNSRLGLACLAVSKVLWRWRRCLDSFVGFVAIFISVGTVTAVDMRKDLRKDYTAISLRAWLVRRVEQVIFG